MHLKTTMRSGNMVVRSTDLRIGYPGKVLFSADPIELDRGDCAALIGPNGTGKTTFLRTLMGQIEPLAGQVRFGTSLKVGYFAQAHDKLNPNNTVLEELLNFRNMPIGQARNYLAQYIFRGEDVYKPIHMLSGGERGRLALALLALEGANLLLLDEPTNHLDIPAQEVLQEVLENFQGTILLVSHDRYLIDRLATQIWELRGSRLHVFEGTYAEFVAERMRVAEKEKERAAKEREAARRSQNVDKGGKIDSRKRVKALEEAENKVHQLENKLAQLEQELQIASATQEFAKIQRLSQEYANTQAALEQSMDTWAELAEV